MSDTGKIRAEVQAAQAENREISDACARVIASQWYGGQNSAGYTFVSTGAFTHPDTLWRELFSADYPGMSQEDRTAADMVGTYLLARYRSNGNAPCPLMVGWSDLWL